MNDNVRQIALAANSVVPNLGCMHPLGVHGALVGGALDKDWE